MSWKVRHQGSPRSVDGLTPQQVIDGLADGLWEPTDEVLGPDDANWVPLELHPLFAEAAAEVADPLAEVPEDETRLDMTPLIDVTLVLLIFFMLGLGYVASHKELPLPNLAAAAPSKGKLKQVSADKAKEALIWVAVRQQGEKTVYTIDGEAVDAKDLTERLKKTVADKRKHELLIDAPDDIAFEAVIHVQDAAKGANIEKAYFKAQQKGDAPQ